VVDNTFVLFVKLIDLGMAERGELVQRAKLAEQAERYDDMASCMKSVRDVHCKIANKRTETNL